MQWDNFQGHGDAVTCVSIKEKVLVSGSRDYKVILWINRAQDEEEEDPDFSMLKIFSGHEEILHFVSQDEDRVYSSDDGGELFVWDKRRVVSEAAGGVEVRVIQFYNLRIHFY